MKPLTIVVIVGLALLSGCSLGTSCGDSKDAFLRSYYDLIDEAAAANLPVSAGQWTSYDERFRAYVEECYEQYEPELSPKERRHFWSKSLKYYAQRYGDGALKELGKKGDKAAGKVKQEVENIWTDAESALKEATGKTDPKKLLKPGQAETE